MERDMASIIFTAKDIFEQDFGREVRGYSKAEVDEFLDDVIKDYETYAALVKSLRLEVAELKEELAKKPQEAPVSVTSESAELGSTTSMTNFDILKRLNRLEKERFEKKITDFSDIEEVKRVFENRHYRIRNEIQEETIVPNELLIEAFQLEYQYVLDQVKSEAISKETSNKLFKEINNAQVLQLQNQ